MRVVTPLLNRERDRHRRCQGEGMQELISPEKAENLILIGAVVLTLGGAIGGWRSRGTAGLIAGLAGPLIYGAWFFHKWMTRYDPASGYFGLDQVKVLVLEVVVFTVIGVAIGIYWSRTGREVARHSEKSQ